MQHCHPKLQANKDMAISIQNVATTSIKVQNFVPSILYGENIAISEKQHKSF